MTALLLLAAASSLQAATVGETDRFLPLIQDGGGWSTQVVIVNPYFKSATVVISFVTSRGPNSRWNQLGLKTSAGKVVDDQVQVTLAPGAMVRIDTAGVNQDFVRGFADVFEGQEQPIAGYAILTQRVDGEVARTIKTPLTPAHERRSILPLDLANPVEISWISLTTTATLDLVFRNMAGETVLKDQVIFDNAVQLFADVRAVWPQLGENFQGTLEWKVTFPGADRYEERVLAAMSFVRQRDGAWTALPAMTLRADQASTSPYAQ